MQYLKEDIQEKILHIAEEVFSEKGYKDASMREIASRTGITVSNIYHYFTNKDEIFRTILKPVLNDLYAKIYSHDANQMSIEVYEFGLSAGIRAGIYRFGFRTPCPVAYVTFPGTGIIPGKLPFGVYRCDDTYYLCLFSGDEAEVPAPEYRYHRFLYSSQYGMAVCLARRTGAAPREERRNAEIYSRIYSL